MGDVVRLHPNEEPLADRPIPLRYLRRVRVPPGGRFLRRVFYAARTIHHGIYTGGEVDFGFKIGLACRVGEYRNGARLKRYHRAGGGGVAIIYGRILGRALRIWMRGVVLQRGRYRQRFLYAPTPLRAGRRWVPGWRRPREMARFRGYLGSATIAEGHSAGSRTRKIVARALFHTQFRRSRR